MATWLQQNNPVAVAKRVVGQTIGAVGGVVNNQAMRDLGGQITGGLRTYNIFNPPATKAADAPINWGPSQDNASWNQPQPQVLGDKTVYNNPGDTTKQGQDIINQNAGDQNSQIDRDYEDAMALLGGQEQQAMGQAAEASGTLGAEQTQVTNQLANQQTVDTQGQEAQVASGEKQGASAMQQARDLFRQTQQNNIAQLSGAGLSSSSVAEALAERLGVETARRIAGVTGSVQEIRQNAVKEMSRIKSYYEGKATEVTQWVANEKLTIQNALNNQLNQINNAKNQATSAKASARASLLSDVRTQLFTLQQQESQFQQSLKAWAQQKAASTQQLITDPNLVASYTANINTLNAQPGINQTNIGNYGVNDQGQTGYYAGPIKSVKKTGSGIIDPITGEEI
jgi:hypothetical protein